jgi:hypothetical protein
MGWTYYTSPLVAGQLLTQNMRHDLFLALSERNNALPSPVPLGEVTGPLESNQVSVYGTVIPWYQAVRAVAAAGYIDPSQNGTQFWGASAPDPFTGVDPVIVATQINDWRYWNAVRAGIIGLNTIRFDLLANGDAETYTKTGMGGPYSTEAAAAVALTGASETNASSGNTGCGIYAYNPSNGSRKFTQCYRNNGSVNFPAGTLLVTLVGGGGNNCAPDLYLGIQSASVITTPFPAPSGYAGFAVSATGGNALLWELHYPGYNSATIAETDFAPFAPTGGDGIGDYQATAAIHMAGGDETGIGIQPAFTYV